MNLIETWGYCAEGKHRLLVYDYMEHGSLADNLSNGKLDWRRRFDIAIGAARGLAYLHEECLEWVLHCDVKPQNILLDSKYQPNVADFGLSKLLNRDESKNLSFSRIRGTRGYMAPEWVYNLPITSKVDVYSYGIVLLEMVTGRNLTGGVLHPNFGGSEQENRRLTSWVREKMNNEGVPVANRIEEIKDHSVEGEYVWNKVEALVAVALQCVAEDRYERPTMRQVVEMLRGSSKANRDLHQVAFPSSNVNCLTSRSSKANRDLHQVAFPSSNVNCLTSRSSKANRDLHQVAFPSSNVNCLTSRSSKANRDLHQVAFPSSNVNCLTSRSSKANRDLHQVAFPSSNVNCLTSRSSKANRDLHQVAFPSSNVNCLTSRSSKANRDLHQVAFPSSNVNFLIRRSAVRIGSYLNNGIDDIDQ
ncbi:hypothetical protein CDL15_Pgr006706 [Punica granatum]|uniref:Protein kinase domain-containing protein n=1 Tax=Punica granatum TaxID=22663 RepID=A0A218X7M9_PUNGR|nr:hypothetical protein CDL15_Pgr006706 [Punica granatum]